MEKLILDGFKENVMHENMDYMLYPYLHNKTNMNAEKLQKHIETVKN